jgi:hypothetical protein
VASTSVSDNALNSHGQVAYRVTFTDNAIATYLYTPTLHWRNESGPRSIGLGSWDDASAWTLGLAPAEMHDVKIDPATRLTLAGPGSDRSVRSLELGTGAGAVRLNLQAGVQLTVLNGGLQIGANGVLSGSGTVAGDLVNRGLIQPTDIVVFDNITNHGRIEGGGHLQGALNNTATGTLSVAAGEQLTVFGFAGGPSTSTAHDNSGTITVAGGGLTLIGGLTNRATLHATDANLSFIGRGFINRANVVLDGTQVDVTGDVFNAASGRIATGEATQVVFHNLVINAGEIAIGAADPAHFLAGLSLSGSSHLSLVLGGNAPSGVALVQAQGAVGLGGVLSLSFATGTVAHAGDSYTLFDFSGATLSHAFAALDLPELGAVGAWDTAELFTSGRIGITAVPEPGAAALLFAGLLTLAFRLRRPARPFIFTTRSLVS